LELPKRRTSPSETFSESAVKASVVLSQMSLSSSIAPLAPRKWKRLRSKSFKNAILHQIVSSRQAGRTASALKIGSRAFKNGRSWADSSLAFGSFDSAITKAIHVLPRLATAGARRGQNRSRMSDWRIEAFTEEAWGASERCVGVAFEFAPRGTCRLPKLRTKHRSWRSTKAHLRPPLDPRVASTRSPRVGLP
jgi:hypothetical protein